MNAARPDIKIRNRRLLNEERRRRRPVLESFPPQIQIEPTNRCNLACASCARNYYAGEKNPPGDLDPSLYPRLEELFVRAESVLLGGYGEPLLGQGAEDIMRLAADHGCAVEVITNGTLIDKRWVRLARSLPVGRFTFSVDASSEGGMTRARGVGLSEVLSHIKEMRDGSPSTQIAINFTLNRGNLGDLAGLIDLAMENGVARIAVAHQKIYTRSQGDVSALNEGTKLDAIFNDARRRARESGIDLELPPTSGARECMQPLELMMIRNDGMAFACCSAMFGGGGARLKLGRLQDAEVKELWNAPAALNARERILGRPHEPGPCDDCAWRVFTPEAMRRFLD